MNRYLAICAAVLLVWACSSDEDATTTPEDMNISRPDSDASVLSDGAPDLRVERDVDRVPDTAIPTPYPTPECIVSQEAPPNDCGTDEAAYFFARTDLWRLEGQTCIAPSLLIYDDASLPEDDPRRWLEPLSQLHYINGALEIGQSAGIHEMDSVTEEPFANPGLTNLVGLRNLRKVEGHLTMLNNVDITSLDGLCNLREVGAIRLAGNRSLSDASGLVSLEKIERDLTLDRNDFEPLRDSMSCVVKRMGEENIGGQSIDPGWCPE